MLDVNPDIIFSIWMTGLSLVLSTFFLFLLVVVRRIFSNKQSEQKIILTKIFQDYIAEFISLSFDQELYASPVEQGAVVNLKRKDLDRKWKRNLLSHQLSTFKLALDGHQAQLIRQLYLGFGFYEDVEKKLKSTKINLIAQGLDSVCDFTLSDLRAFAVKHISHSNRDIMIKAILAVIEIDAGKLQVLTHVKTTLSNWDKHKILELLRKFGNIESDYIAELSSTLPEHQEFLEEIQQTLCPQEDFYLELINEYSLQ